MPSIKPDEGVFVEVLESKIKYDNLLPLISPRAVSRGRGFPPPQPSTKHAIYIPKLDVRTPRAPLSSRKTGSGRDYYRFHLPQSSFSSTSDDLNSQLDGDHSQLSQNNGLSYNYFDCRAHFDVDAPEVRRSQVLFLWFQFINIVSCGVTAGHRRLFPGAPILLHSPETPGRQVWSARHGSVGRALQ